jgi:hypothetical protein
MTARIVRIVVAVAFALAFAFGARSALAGAKDECIDAHSRGQDLRDRGQLVRARQVFMACAQSSCPSLVQGDCARFGEEVARLVPTVSFGARDAAGTDLAATTVMVDDVQMTNRLDDGRSFEVDPGRHTIRFVHDGKETQLHVVLNQGEKGRTLVATFPAEDAPRSTTDPSRDAAVPTPKRPVTPLLVAGLGAATMVTGAVLIAVGMHEVPAECNVSTKECAAPPDDPILASAHHGVAMADTGVGLAVGGGAVLVGGLVWYFLQSPTVTPSQTGTRGVTPWVGRDTAGVGWSGTF